MKRLRLADAPDALSVSEAAAVLGLSADLVYQAIHTGALQSVRLGRRLIVPKVALLQMLEGPGLDKEPNPSSHRELRRI